MYFPVDKSVIPYLPPKHYAPELFEPGRKPTSMELEIDWSNPLTRGLKGCWIFGYGAESPANIVDGRPLEHGAGASLSPDGVSFPAGVGNNTAYHAGENMNFRLNAHTYMADIISASSATRHIVGVRDDLPQDRLVINNSNKVTLNATVSVVGATTVTTGTKLLATATVDDSSFASVYYNDILDASGTATIDSNAGEVTIGAMGSGTHVVGDLVIKRVWIWDRALTAAEVASMSANKNQFLVPKGIPKRVVKKAPGLWIPDRRLEMPSLFEPGKKPTGPMEIDWSNPITRKLKSCVLIDPPFIDLVTGLHWTPGSAIIQAIAPSGRGMEFPEALGATLTSPTSYNWLTLGSVTLYMGGQNLTENSPRGYGRLSASYAQGLYLEAALTYIDGFFGSASSTNILPTGSFGAGDEFSLAISMDCVSGASGNNYAANFGEETLNNSTTQTWSASAETPIMGSNSATEGTEGIMLCVAIFSPRLSNSETRAMSADPYQFLVPK